MSNTVSFLKNYVVFGYKVRTVTSKGYLKLLENADERDSKIFMLRIAEELSASTEDLYYWLTAVMLRENADKRYRDIWDFLHECDTGDVEVLDKIKQISKKRTASGLLTLLNSPKPEELASLLKADTGFVVHLYKNLFNATKASIHNRSAKNGMFIRVQNKIKHAMTVQEIPEGVLIKDIKVTPRNKKNRIGKIIHFTRRIVLELDKERAKKLVATIESNGLAVQTLAFIVMSDIGKNIRNLKGKKLTKKLRTSLEESLKSFSI